MKGEFVVLVVAIVIVLILNCMQSIVKNGHFAHAHQYCDEEGPPPSGTDLFGYFCTSKSTGMKLPYGENRKICSRIPNDGDLEVYESEGAICIRYHYWEQDGGPCGQSETGTRNMHFVPDPTPAKNVAGATKKSKNRCGNCRCNSRGKLRSVYHSPTDKCYYSFSQGYCPNGEWLIWSHPHGTLKCEPNPCQTGNNGKQLILFNGRCVELYTKVPECTGENQVVGFEWNNPEPTCSYKPPHTSSKGTTTPTPNPNHDICPNGQSRSLSSNQCQNNSLG